MRRGLVELDANSVVRSYDCRDCSAESHDGLNDGLRLNREKPGSHFRPVFDRRRTDAAEATDGQIDRNHMHDLIRFDYVVILLHRKDGRRGPCDPLVPTAI